MVYRAKLTNHGISEGANNFKTTNFSQFFLYCDEFSSHLLFAHAIALHSTLEKKNIMCFTCKR